MIDFRNYCILFFKNRILDCQIPDTDAGRKGKRGGRTNAE